jgi:hypothetical protein
LFLIHTLGHEPELISRKEALQKQIWQAMQTITREQLSTSTSTLAAAALRIFPSRAADVRTLHDAGCG